MRNGGIDDNAIENNLEDAKHQLKKTVQRLLLQNLTQYVKSNDEPADGSVKQPVLTSTHQLASRKSDYEVAGYLRNNGYEYALSVFMAEADILNPRDLTIPRVEVLPSRFLKGTADFRNAVFEIWEKLEKKYDDKLQQYIVDWEVKQSQRLKHVERALRSAAAEKELEMKRELARRIDSLEARERNLAASYTDKTAAMEAQVEESRRRLVDDARELNSKRAELQTLEGDFVNQVRTEQNRIRLAKEKLDQLAADLKRQQLQITFQMDDAVQEARRREQARYGEKLQELTRKEEKLRDAVEKMKSDRGAMHSLKASVQERDSKIHELETLLLTSNAEIKNLQDKLREKDDSLYRMTDYELLKNEVRQLKDQMRVIREQAAREKLQLQQQVYTLDNECRELATRLFELAPNEENPIKKDLTSTKAMLDKASGEWSLREQNYREQIEQERQQNDVLKRQMADQTSHMKALAQELKKLQFLVSKRALLSHDEDQSSVRRRGDIILSKPALAKNLLGDQTPDFVSEAKRCLQNLERETEVFEESLRRYRHRSMDDSSLALLKAKIVQSTNITQFWRAQMTELPPDNFEYDRQPSDDARQQISVLKPKQDVVVQQIESPKPVQRSEPTPWEIRLKEREAERQRQQEELRRNRTEVQQQAINQTQDTGVASVTAASVAEKPKEPQQSDPQVDPVLHKYMQMVLEQRQREQNAPEAQSEKPLPEQNLPKTNEVEVEVAALEEASISSDFEW